MPNLIPETTSPEQVLAMAFSARESLKSRLRNTAREYSDRIKQLDDIMRAASNQVGQQTHGDMLPGTPAMALSPDKQKLLVNPTHGL